MGDEGEDEEKRRPCYEDSADDADELAGEDSVVGYGGAKEYAPGSRFLFGGDACGGDDDGKEDGEGEEGDDGCDERESDDCDASRQYADQHADQEYEYKQQDRSVDEEAEPAEDGGEEFLPDHAGAECFAYEDVEEERAVEDVGFAFYFGGLVFFGLAAGGHVGQRGFADLAAGQQIDGDAEGQQVDAQDGPVEGC